MSGKSTLTVGETAKLTAKTTPSNANNLFTWKSSNSGVVTVSKSGEIVAKKAGTATITVTATDKSKKTATIKIVVNKKVVETEKVDTTPETEKQTESETPSETLPDDSATMDPTESSGGTTETEGTLDEDDTEKVTEGNDTMGSEDEKVTEKETESETQKQTETETEKQTETESETTKQTETTPSETETESETQKQTETESESETETESETEKQTEASDDYSDVGNRTIPGGGKVCFSIKTDKSADCFSVASTGNSLVVVEIYSDSGWVDIILVGRYHGTSEVAIKCNGTIKATCTVTVTSDDSRYINYTTWKENVKSKIWSEGMNDIAKLTAIGDYICQNYDYNASNWDYYCFANGEGGDCYAASHLICDFATDLGLENRVDHVYGVATHVCAVVKINGTWYSFDSGTNDTAGNRACLVKIVS